MINKYTAAVRLKQLFDSVIDRFGTQDAFVLVLMTILELVGLDKTQARFYAQELWERCQADRYTMKAKPPLTPEEVKHIEVIKSYTGSNRTGFSVETRKDDDKDDYEGLL